MIKKCDTVPRRGMEIGIEVPKLYDFTCENKFIIGHKIKTLQKLGENVFNNESKTQKMTTLIVKHLARCSYKNIPKM